MPAIIQQPRTALDRFSTRLKQVELGAILTDGSMEVTLNKKGLTDPLVEAYNLSQPLQVEQAHRDFADAGAELLTTNTVRANPITLAKYGIQSKTYEINRKGVWLA